MRDFNAPAKNYPHLQEAVSLRYTTDEGVNARASITLNFNSGQNYTKTKLCYCLKYFANFGDFRGQIKKRQERSPPDFNKEKNIMQKATNQLCQSISNFGAHPLPLGSAVSVSHFHLEVVLWQQSVHVSSFKICQVIYSQFGLAIHPNGHQARRRFVEWVQNEIAVVPDFHKRILFSDEAHFWLNGYVNKQNCRIWSEANPQVYAETSLHPEKLTVWCALWAGGIIGPYFFKNDEGHNVTVNDDRYRAMITNFFIPELNNHDVQELWFQQDGATCHTARATIDLLKDPFGDRLISRFGPVNWPPRSCDLTPLDYFLWGYVKSLVYADKPQTLDYLEDNIRRVIADIRPQMLEKVIENWTSRLDYIRASRGSPMSEIIFKM
ncbi:uncharacterized protein TNCV_3468411 [Trichonephila clavipes]|nr:uncharacterized protein TNCV_3468411 [Trichonephila clavipes]